MIERRDIRRTWQLEKSSLWPLIVSAAAGVMFGILLLDRVAGFLRS